MFRPKSFLTPDEAIDAEIGTMTPSINAALAGGSRMFTVPSRVVEPLRERLAMSGWSTNTEPSDETGVTVINLNRPP